MNRKKILFALFGALLLAGLSGCGSSRVATHFSAPAFSLSALRAGPSLLIVSPETHVTGFKKTYDALFPDSTALSARLSARILDSLKGSFSVLAVPAMPDSALRARLAASGAGYAIRVSDVAIGDTLLDNPDVLLPGVGGMQPSGGGISTACLVELKVEILDTALTRVHAFSVRSRSDAILYAYKTALLKALDAAALKAAAHLAGR